MKRTLSVLAIFALSVVAWNAIRDEPEPLPVYDADYIVDLYMQAGAGFFAVPTTTTTTTTTVPVTTTTTTMPFVIEVPTIP